MMSWAPSDRHVEHGRAIDRHADAPELVRDETRAQIGSLASLIRMPLEELAEAARGRAILPMRRPEALNPSAFLIDENRRVGIADRVAQLPGQRRDLRRVVDIAREQDEPERPNVTEERALVGRQFGSLATIDRGTCRHCDLNGSERAFKAR